ncbi:Diacylglycerol kinase catalytic region OS=Tsukamurella paurometabola (strain ATCC 8368 / DSM/ CCUG 35730 / CIP 100753 / JCM 10117 / KCTC 9821 / NBRC 16120/ NCIMB 702349 / NCTC 13040) OX=521096 GN=Tpau_1959 PE=4 SV=1 [Tsukamurella paurometabola]|uniref:Diacylglycerol kinase catalytic region n=1 Tax=Tsukamurella paurometabola (strain ATCC 8368 / DSM 20162 / CCUG 35730 / CIP 100753 / JCM 10117 / KCTC 9821 / NBRC 16120 / NCIMB 702349 / NCTC 13040) TaxID=521096 RepID=D5UNK3_TSUPD|nr:diacylglycerol kinase family protein [Tsukamurella paurometabola]ADG78571.1 diacylglycerol kinase catalytic region [Tsukamurella paurometabola DSM 20162]SUP32234.1 Diacylglycerol kinase [Tsukamurella paurometabola]
MSARPDVVAVINPISGGGAAREQWAAVAAELHRYGMDVEAVESDSGEDAAARAAEAAASGALTVAVGGDGQIRDVASGVLRVPGAPLGIAAAGRGNDFVRHLGMPIDPAGIAAVLADGRRRDLDVLTVGDRIAVGNVYVGLDSVATEMINRLRWMGPLAYRIAPALAALRWKPATFTVTVDGVAHRLLAHIVVIANSGRYGSGLHMVPSASADNGRIDVLAVRGEGSVVRLIGAMGEAKTGVHVHRPEVITFTGQEISVTADRPIPVHSDGDYLQKLPVTVGLRKAVLPVLVPR